MITSELISYIKSQLDAGMTEMQIGTILKANGWIEADIHEAFSTIYPAPAQPVQVAPVAQQAPEIIQMTEPMYVESFKPVEYTRPQPEPIIQPVQMFEPVQAQPVQPIQMTQSAQVMQPEPVMTQSQPVVNPVVMQPAVETMPLMQAQAMPSMQAQTPYQQPVQQNIYMQQPMQQVQPTGGRAKKFILPLIVLILLLAVSGGAYAYFTGYFTPLEKVTSQAFQAMVAANSATFDVTTSIDASGLLKGEDVNTSSLLPTGFLTGKTSITTKGIYDSSDAANKKFSSTISVDAGTVSAAAEVRAINGVLYTQITKSPSIAMLPILSSLEKQWVSFPYNTAESVASIPILGRLDPKILNELTPAQKNEFYKITNNAHFIKVTQKLETETINDVSNYHFMFDLDREGIIAYLNDIKTYVRDIGKNDSKLSSFDPTTYAKDLENVHDFKGEAWIGKKDKLLHKFDISMTVIDSNTEKDGIKIGMVALFDKFNQPVTVETPASTMTFNEFTEKLFSGMMSGDPDATGLLDGAVDASLDNANAKAEEAKLKSMVSNARASAELYYDKSKSYSGFCDSKEYQKASEITCASSKSGFFAITPLQGGRFYCADATGFSGEVSAKPTSGTVCPKK